MHRAESGSVSYSAVYRSASDAGFGVKRALSACAGSPREWLPPKVRPGGRSAGSRVRAHFPVRSGNGRNRRPPGFRARSPCRADGDDANAKRWPSRPPPGAAKRPHSTSSETPGRPLRAALQNHRVFFQPVQIDAALDDVFHSAQRRHRLTARQNHRLQPAPPPRPLAHRARQSLRKARKSGTRAPPLG